MDQCDEGTLELDSEFRWHSDWTEGEPEDDLCGIGDDEKGDSWAQAPAFFEQIVEEDDDAACAHKLCQDEYDGELAHLRRLSVGSDPDGSNSFSETANQG